MNERNTKHAISIDKDLYDEIAEYCNLNDLIIGEFINSALKKLIATEKYGDVPFGTLKDGELPKIKTTEPEIEDAKENKSVQCTAIEIVEKEEKQNKTVQHSTQQRRIRRL